MVQRKQRIVLKDFSFKVGELIVEQEVSEDELSMPDTALKAIGQVISTPQQLLGFESNGTGAAPTPEPVPTLPTAARVRRRRRAVSSTADGSTGDGHAPKPSGAGAALEGTPAQILELRQDGFFREKRDAGQVRSKLHERGHTAATAGTVRMALLALTVRHGNSS